MSEGHLGRSVQAPGAVVMIRPHHFRPNGETAKDNAFQRNAGKLAERELSRRAYAEVTNVIAALEEVGVQTHVFEDDDRLTPDSVFPNNWFSTHPGGHIAIFPMFPHSRRKERRGDVIEMLKRDYRVQEVVDYSGLEHDGLFLEGTGAMVLDHIARVAYVVHSNRADPIILERFCAHFKYEPMVFDARDARGVPIYHTNVLMCIATDFVLLGLDMMTDDARRRHILERFEESGRQVIPLSAAQIADFAGNAIELQGASGRVLALSRRAFNALHPDQIAIINQSADLLALDVPTIELAGGSIRCMLASVHLSPR